MTKPVRKQTPRKQLSAGDVEKQLALAAQIDGLLAERSRAEAAKTSNQPEASRPVLRISLEDGRAATACSKGNERAVLQWLFEGLHPILSAGPSGQETTTLPLEAALSAILSTEPRSPIESLLITQMLGSHSMAMQFGTRALNASDSSASSRLAERARGFMEISCRQMETLMKLRGESVQQKVVVQHVTLSGDAQAIIGQVQPGGTPHK